VKLSQDHRQGTNVVISFTKWVEVIPLRKVTQKVVISFIPNHILHRFGIPETITTVEKKRTIY